MSENVGQTNSTSTDRGADRGERSDRGEAQELSHGKRDRSREMLREELERNLDDATRRTGGRPRDFEPEGRPAREAKSATDKTKDRDPTTSADGAAAPGADGSAGAAIDTSAPPAAWKTAAKNAWHRTPPEVQEAVAKREIDHDRGVEPLKQKIAQHAEEDAAWAPWEPALRQASVPRAQAIANLMSWHQYLQRDPLAAFPALVKSIGAEPAFRELLQRQQAGAQPQQQVDPLDQRLQPYLQHFEQRLGTFQQHVDAQQERAVNDILANWSRDKPFYEKVRGVMAAGISSGAVPLKGGAVDLDGAYAFACAADPTIREEMITQRIASERKRQSEQADRARRSSASLSPFAPGSNNSVGAAKNKRRGVSVRDSINAAMDEVADR